MILMSLVLLTLGCNTSPPVETDLYIYLDFTEGQDYIHQITEDLDNYGELLQVGENGSPNFGKVKIFPFLVPKLRSLLAKLCPAGIRTSVVTIWLLTKSLTLSVVVFTTLYFSALKYSVASFSN